MPDLPKLPEVERLPGVGSEHKEQLELSPLDQGRPTKPEDISLPQEVYGPATGVAAAPARQIPALQQAVESVLEENLSSLFRELTPAQQIEFKNQGEVVAGRIAKLLQQAKVKVGQILRLIREWLGSLPGINKYFIEQEAKIKADKIIKLH
jgi:hypothetical protein